LVLAPRDTNNRYRGDFELVLFNCDSQNRGLGLATVGSILSRNLASKLFFFRVEVVDPTSNLLAIPEVASFVTSLYPDAVVVGSIAACGLGSGRHQF
jgi:hypothetical protein